MKILNLYAGIGGNRKLWGDEHEITAIEINPEIAKIYQSFFPKDKVIVADAHQYLLEHFKEFDFIWSSPPCPSHSKIRNEAGIHFDKEIIYPDMKLYEEIILLKHFFKGFWVVENVISYYEPLIKPIKLQRHYFWSNFTIPLNKHFEQDNIYNSTTKSLNGKVFDISKFKSQLEYSGRTALRNCVNPKLALYIFNFAFKEKQQSLIEVRK